MKLWQSFISVFFLLSQLTQVNALIDWQQAAKTDLYAIHQAILDNSVAAIGYQTPNFKRWFEPGYQSALQKVNLVHDYPSYRHLLQYYVNGLHTPHFFINFEQTIPVDLIQWPGFMIGMRNGQLEVTYVEPQDQNKLPSLGAKLIECDGKNLDALFMSIVAPFIYPDPQYHDYWPMYAPNILINDDNPFVHYPHVCTFLVNGNKKQFVLNWHVVDGSLQVFNQLIYHVNKSEIKQTHFAIAQFGERGVWISIPTFEGNEDSLNAIAQKLPDYRNYQLIVFDMRDNGGGNGEAMAKIITALYGNNYLVTLGSKQALNVPIQTQWRVSTGNIQHMQKLDKQTADVLRVGQNSNEKLVNITEAPNREPVILPSSVNPVKAKVVLLTNANCYSACWLFVRNMRVIPGVIQVGQLTAVMDRYSDPRMIEIRSGVTLGVAMASFIKPTDHFGKPFVPQIIYPGDISDTNLVRAWMINIEKPR